MITVVVPEAFPEIQLLLSPFLRVPKLPGMNHPLLGTSNFNQLTTRTSRPSTERTISLISPASCKSSVEVVTNS